MASGSHKKEPVLPILGYYLTFIHYFGFSINPNDDVNSRYLSIRRAPQPQPQPGSPTPSREATGRRLPNGGGRYDQWLATYRLRAQHTLNSMPMLLIRFLRTSVKFTAIAFTTFIALNHCIVLADYIYQGSKVFLELMLEVRLVITKFSALIFVLSWQFNQTKVRQLIKLVKSTSIYIIGTQSNHWLALELRALREPTFCSSSSSAAAAAAAAATGGSNLLASIRRKQVVCRHLSAAGGRLEQVAAAGVKMANGDDDDDDDQEDEREQDEDNEVAAELNEVRTDRDASEEIGDTLLMNINYMDRRFLKWWIMCICVTILHFSLSEVEVSKSNHLWQWLDDYSLHQLNNQTIGNSTLMLLASFDNYIYTVHVYGTRLIGASIICIVCSLQRENIISLRWHALQLIRASADPATERARQRGGPQRDDDAAIKPDNKRGQVRQGLSTRAHSDEPAGGCWRTRPPDDSAQVNADPVERPPNGAGCCDCCGIDRNSFFILGESDWLRVRESARNSLPSGYLSSALHRAKCALMALCGRLAGLLRDLCLLDEQSRARLGGSLRGVFAKRATNVTPDSTTKRHQQRQGDSLDAAHLKPQSRRQQQHRRQNCNIHQLQMSGNHHLGAAAAGATPTPTVPPSPMTSLHQIANSMLMNGSRAYGGRDHAACVNRRLHLSAAWTTPKDTTAASNNNNNASQQIGGQHESITGESAHLHHHHRYRMFEPPPTAATINAAALGHPASGRNSIEWQLERLASKYELVRTVNARIDSCFGPMLLTQYSFLFLMSCIDVVYFSICFNPNTKTKYIIISGMILLWWPYLLLYKFASDIGTDSKELLISVRRLARLWLLEHHNSRSSQSDLRLADGAGDELAGERTKLSPWWLYRYPYTVGRGLGRGCIDGGNISSKFGTGQHLTYCSPALAALGGGGRYPFSLLNNEPTLLSAWNRDKILGGSRQRWPFESPLLARRHFWARPTSLVDTNQAECDKSSANGSRQARACIINKLDHVFKPTYLSIVGMMIVDKFFLLNFAKIVITASVMVIQFIT